MRVVQESVSEQIELEAVRHAVLAMVEQHLTRDVLMAYVRRGNDEYFRIHFESLCRNLVQTYPGKN